MMLTLLRDIFVVDPLWKEEKVAKGRFSVMLNSNLEICSIQKAGGMALDVSNIMRYVHVDSLECVY